MHPPKFLSELLPKPWGEHSETEKVFFKVFISYAAADAFGAFYEFSGAPEDVPKQLKSKQGWPHGGISDDTMLTILTLISLDTSTPNAAALKFLELLKENINSLRGLGPTTRNALGLEVKPREIESVGITNGGLMRTCLVAMAFKEKSERDNWLSSLVRVTHKGEVAIRCALEVGDLIHNSSLLKSDRDLNSFPNGVSNSSEETLSAVHAILANSKSLEEVMRCACGLGGDTDTTAAVSSAIYSFWNNESDEVFALPWLSEVNWSELKHAPSALEALYRRARA